MNAIILSVWIDGDLTDDEADALCAKMQNALPNDINRRVFDTTYRREEEE